MCYCIFKGARIMWPFRLALLLLMFAPELAVSQLSCGTSVDVTNIGSEISVDSSGLSSKFDSLDVTCFSKIAIFSIIIIITIYKNTIKYINILNKPNIH